MRAIFTCDTHIDDPSPEEFGFGLRLLRDAAMLAATNRCKHVIIAGDFLNYRNKQQLSPRLLVGIYNTLVELQKLAAFIVLRGNHDIPDKEDAEFSPLQLFSRVAVVINKTQVVEEDDCIIAFVPWYPHEEYRKQIHAAAQAVMGSNKPRILISHISLQEGKVSPSNMKIETPVKLEHLMPGIWNGGIYLGDYHAHQVLPGNVGMYGGAPRYMNFGDFDCGGMWLIGNRFEDRKKLILPSRYPEFHSYRVDRETDIPLPAYDGRNKNRIFCASALVGRVSSLYPDARIQLIEEERPSLAGRLTKEDKVDPVTIALKWRELKKLESEVYDDEIRRLLQ